MLSNPKIAIASGTLKLSELGEILPWLSDAMAEQFYGWLWHTDANHCFTYLSQSVRQFAGRDVEWHLGKTRQELGNVRTDDAAAAPWIAPLERRELFGPLEFSRFQGARVVKFVTMGHPTFDGLGRFKGYRGLALAVASMNAPQ
jgi:PAS domain-containing protein